MSTANKGDIESRRAEVAEIKLSDPSKTTRQIAKEVGVSNGTVSTDLHAIKQDGTLSQMLQELKEMSLANAHRGTAVENKYVAQLGNKNKLSSQEAATLSSITKSNQQRYSFLQGEVSDEQGGAKVYNLVDDTK